MDCGLQVGKSRDANTVCAINVKFIYSFFFNKYLNIHIFEHPHSLISILNRHFEYPGVPSMRQGCNLQRGIRESVFQGSLGCMVGPT